MLIRQSFNDRIEITGDAQASPNVYRLGGLPKPCFHPLTTPAGHCITSFEPSDHVWHRGLWFTIKFINGTNYWEEHAPFGVQVSTSQPSVELIDAEAVRVRHHQRWEAEATGVVFHEERVMMTRKLPGGVTQIDWQEKLIAQQDLTLDRTPFTTWGGYGGLSFRAARELHDAKFILPNNEEPTFIPGQSHDWVIVHGKMDGGPDQTISLGMIDHPANPRSPSPWYCRTANGATFMNAAFLFHGLMTIKAGEALSFRYRVLFRDGAWTRDEFAAIAKTYRETSESA